MVVIWCGSTEIFLKPHAVYATPETFVAAMKENHPAIAPSMLYAYAAITSGVPFANGAPNLTVDIPAIVANWPSSTACPSAARISKPGKP